MEYYFVCTILILCISHTYSFTYRFWFQNSDVFSACENQPKNVLDVNGLFDLTNIHSEFDENGELIFSGNFTTVWDIQLTDRIKVIIDYFFSF